MQRVTQNGQFALNVVVNGKNLAEITQDGETYVVAKPGQNYSVQLVLPCTATGYGAVFTVDGMTCYGTEQPDYNLAASPDAPALPRGLTQEDSDPSENEFPGPMVGNSIEGLFVFAQNTGSELSGAGLIQVDYYTNAHVPTRSSGGSRGAGGDLHTELDCGTGSIAFNYDFVYEPGELICSLQLRYASEAWLRANGLIG